MSHPRGGEPRPPNGVLPQLGYFVAAALLYVVLARIGLKLTIPPHDIAVFWPPNGVLLAMLLASDRRRWPAIFGGLITGHYLLRLLVDRPQVIDTVYLTANLAELWIGASLIRRFCGEALTFRSMREVLALLGGSIVLGCGVSATMAAAVTVYHFKDLSFLSVWRSWWVADAMSVLLITPMLVTLSPHSRALGAPSGVGSRLEGLVLFVLLAVVSELVFGLEGNRGQEQIPMMYAVFPFVLWAAVRFGPRGASLASFLVSMIAIINASLERGPRFFGPGGAANTAYWIQVYLAVVVLSCIIMAAVWSERSDAADLLRKEQNYTANILSTAPALISGLRLDGHVVSINPAVTTLAGYSPESIVGKNFWEVFFPGELAKEGEKARAVLERDPAAGFETTLRAEDGSLRAIAFRAAQMREGDGRGAELILIGTDVTARRWAEEELRRTLDALEKRVEQRTVELKEAKIAADAANKAKSDFLTNMSHELRTPLNGIIGFAELMYDGKVGPMSDVHKEYTGDILSSGQHLLQLINDILDLAKIEAGRMDLRPEPVDPKAVVAEVRDTLREIAARRQISIEMDVDPALHRVVVDVAKLKQILYNYLSNGLKFTREGGRVHVRVRPEGEEWFRVEVEDEGMGIRPEDLEHLFVAFQQLDASASKRHQGTGLGLALTKRIVEVHGGRVGVTSTVGKGSTFFAVLPLVTAGAREPDGRHREAPPRGASTGAPTVLVIEEDERERLWLLQTLTEAGYAVEAVGSGEGAVARCRERVFDAITLDILMEGESGLDVLRQLREEGLNTTTAVIVVTATAELGLADSFAIHDVLTKPVQADALLASLERTGVQPGPACKILVIDDDPGACKIIGATLTQLGYQAVCAKNGVEGLSALKEERPSAIVLDLLMPEMDGFEFLERLRDLPDAAPVPIIVWTVTDLAPDERAKLRASVQAIIQKSRHRVNDLLDEINRACASSHASEGPAPETKR